jgi:UDP:flavonoid glycosyltransferase YjiC (YdhE family)
MYRADFAVTALGLTAYELLAVGTPIVGTPQAPDQEPKAETLREEAVAIVLSRDATVPEITEAITTMTSDEGSRRRFQRRGKDLVDVDGVDRFVTCLERLAG